MRSVARPRRLHPHWGRQNRDKKTTCVRPAGVPCFADTFFFLALLNRADRAFPLAVEANRVDRPVVTTAWVLLELADHLCDVRNRGLVRGVREALGRDPRYEIVPAHQPLLDRATDLYERRPDKDWSLTDCTSLVVMGDRGLHQALTADRHFEQAGFVALLKARGVAQCGSVIRAVPPPAFSPSFPAPCFPHGGGRPPGPGRETLREPAEDRAEGAV